MIRQFISLKILWKNLEDWIFLLTMPELPGIIYVMRMSEQEWDSVIAVNLKGSLQLYSAATKTFMKQRDGRIS